MRIQSPSRKWVTCLAAMLLPANVLAANNQAPLVDAARQENLIQVRELLQSGVAVNQIASDGTTALHWMVRAENTDLVDELIAKGADPNLADRNDVTPLYLSISLSNQALTDRLLKAGADPNAINMSGENLLMLATHMGDAGIVQSLLQHGAEVNFSQADSGATPLMLAVREATPKIVEMLIARGAEVNVATTVGEKPERLPPGFGGGSHGVGIVRGGVPPNGQQTPTVGGMTALLYAARDGQTEMIRMLLDAGADIEQAEANNITPLPMAVSNGNFDASMLLVDSGADIDAADDFGRTALWHAIDYRNLDFGGAGSAHNNGIDREAAMPLIRKLLEAGAKVNVRTTDLPPVRRYVRSLGDFSWVNFVGQTPFLRAALSADVEIMRMLLDHGADPNIETDQGSSALMAAAGVNWVYQQTYTVSDDAELEAVKMCLDLGADINHTNSMGLSAIHGAANRGSNHIIQFLYENGADLTLADNEDRTPYVWAQGVFLATNGVIEKTESMALIQKLTGARAAK